MQNAIKLFTRKTLCKLYFDRKIEKVYKARSYANVHREIKHFGSKRERLIYNK